MAWGGLVLACVAARGADAPGAAEVLGQAMRERRVVVFSYHGYPRTAEPHAVGRANDGKPALLAWQTSGGSSTEPPPGWRVFLLEEMAGLTVSSATFDKPRADYTAKGRGLKTVDAEVGPPAGPAGK